MKNFQVIKHNANGTIVLEYSVYKNMTIEHPTTNGELLRGDALIYAINDIIDQEHLNVSSTLAPWDISGNNFCEEYGIFAAEVPSVDPEASTYQTPEFIVQQLTS